MRPSTDAGASRPDSIEQNNHPSEPLAPIRHPLLRLWLVGTIGVVLTIATGAFWWEKQLPGRLKHAAEANDLEACLRYSEQLAALQWLGQTTPEEQAICRRRQGQRLWERGDTANALSIQRQLVLSGRGTPTQRQADRDTLAIWQSQLRVRALEAIERLRETQDHHQHGSSKPDVIGGALLDGEVQRLLLDGLSPWEAFQTACDSLGGSIEEDGPESFCQRRGIEGP